MSTKLGCIDKVEYEIELFDKEPVKLKLYTYAQPKIRELREIIKQFLSQGVTRPSNTDYASPAFLVKKKMMEDLD